MRLAIFSDVHANIEALSAVMERVRHEGVDKCFCLGDVVGYGASPNECCDVVKRADIDAAIAAWASPQSRPLADRRALDELVAQAEERFDGRDVPLPPFWGGYRLIPESIELWTHRDDRLHDRVLYTRGKGGWRRERLAP